MISLLAVCLPPVCNLLNVKVSKENTQRGRFFFLLSMLILGSIFLGVIGFTDNKYRITHADEIKTADAKNAEDNKIASDEAKKYEDDKKAKEALEIAEEVAKEAEEKKIDDNKKSTAAGKNLYLYFKKFPGNNWAQGINETEFLDGKLISTCKVGGKYPSYFGWFTYRYTFFNGRPTSESEPTKRFIYVRDNSSNITGLYRGEDQLSAIYETMQEDGCQIPEQQKSQNIAPFKAASHVKNAVEIKLPENLSCTDGALPSKWEDGKFIFAAINAHEISILTRRPDGSDVMLVYTTNKNDYGIQFVMKGSMDIATNKIYPSKGSVKPIELLSIEKTGNNGSDIKEENYDTYKMNFQGSDFYCLGYNN
jgi:hypothetical protein